MARFDLSDFKGSVIQPLLQMKMRDVPRADDCKVLNGIVESLRTARLGLRCQRVTVRTRRM